MGGHLVLFRKVYEKNMKIAITPEQPLDDVVRELVRLGFSPIDTDVFSRSKHGYSFDNGEYHFLLCFDESLWRYETTTLTELKEMERYEKF